MSPVAADRAASIRAPGASAMSIESDASMINAVGAMAVIVFDVGAGWATRAGEPSTEQPAKTVMVVRTAAASRRRQAFTSADYVRGILDGRTPRLDSFERTNCRAEDL